MKQHTSSNVFYIALILASIMMTSITGCVSNKPYSPGPFEPADSAPDHVKDWHNIPNATPKHEPRARYGNHSPYEVFGKKYYVLESSAGYREAGIGSWYGKKFAGRPTSSQEPYDPYAMTAAHKTLPIPSYVQVTNLENNQQIIVRVNDRGPFHGGRIIDLSYAAAHKIGYANQGTARVLVEVIDMPGTPASVIPNATPYAAQPGDKNIYLQVGAFQDLQTAKTLQQQLIAHTNAPVGIYSNEVQNDDLHRVRIGPFDTEQAAEHVQQQIRNTQIADPLLIRR